MSGVAVCLSVNAFQVKRAVSITELGSPGKSSRPPPKSQCNIQAPHALLCLRQSETRCTPSPRHMPGFLLLATTRNIIQTNYGQQFFPLKFALQLNVCLLLPLLNQGVFVFLNKSPFKPTEIRMPFFFPSFPLSLGLNKSERQNQDLLNCAGSL